MKSERRRRSVLFAPAHRDDLLRKMRRAKPDVVVLDLEDGTPPDAKDRAREIVTAVLSTEDFGGAERVIRINAMSSEFAKADLAWLRDVNPEADSVMIPKVDHPDELKAFEFGVGHRWPLWILPTETAAGYAKIRESVRFPAVTAVIWAAEDLAGDIGAAGSRNGDGQLREVFRTVRAETLLASKGAGVSAIDTTYLDIENLDALRDEAAETCAMGFDGKAAIHPSHITVINEEFTPGAQAVAEAKRLLDAMYAAGGGAIRFEGRMIDAPHVRQAKKILLRAGEEVGHG